MNISPVSEGPHKFPLGQRCFVCFLKDVSATYTMSPRQSLLHRVETGLSIHSVTCQVEYLHSAADHTKSRIIKIDICVIQITFRIQFVYSMLAYYIQPHIACSYFHQPFFPTASIYYLPLRRSATANRSLSLSLSLPLPCRWLSLFYSPPVFCQYANFLQIS